MNRRDFALALFAGAASLGPSARAVAADPAIGQIDAFDTALLDAMKGGATLGVKGRYRRLQPVIDRVFDMPAMTRFAVGPAWSTFTPAQQAAVQEAFARNSVANYASNFSGWSGERFEIDPAVQTRGPDKIVQSRILRPKDAPVNLIYRMRQSGGAWRIIDVYYGAISQLTTRRSDFAGPIAKGGADGLLKHLNTLTDALLEK